ncbi:MAG: 3-oxoacyl-ACP synthase [Acidimicrobiia bacterium]|nr:3-oxoacyl-ACP synthase [Acidimicrobiia bacterium]MBT8191837.1 3-oxoacyl-ACP synthase [Acidimicrobiia bacterium]NNL14922.1 3-oxoacyl-ACP synthase [Acidimicrobiia bacterium]NNL97645.1 3-oxoacyl-ACP synthase [Acidimicrobiia bacterium]
MSENFTMGIVATGHFLPETYMTGEEIAEASGMPEWVVKDKLGISRKHVTDPEIHPNEMGVLAAKQAIANAGIDPMEIDVVLCTTEEWKEYNLWTAGIDLAWEVGARNAWGMDMHMRCATTVAALKLAKSLMREDDSINTVLIAGGYTIADFIDFTNHRTSFLFNIGAGGGAVIVKRDWPDNHVLGTHLLSDGSMSRHVLVPASGTKRFPSDEAVAAGAFKFDLLEPEAMKGRLNEVSMSNWLFCIDEALAKSGVKEDGSPYGREDIDYVNILLIKPSAHKQLLDELGKTEDQAAYLGDIGHIGEQDTIISMIEGEKQGKLKPGDLMVMVGAGIGYVWSAGIVKWGPE